MVHLGSRKSLVIYTQLNQYYVVLEVAPQYWQSPQGLKDTYLQSKTGHNIPLAAVSKNQTNTTPLAIAHTGLFPSVTGVVQPRHRRVPQRCNHGNQRHAKDAWERRHRRFNAVFFAGTAAAYQQSLSTQGLLITTALLAVYIVLGILYESLVHPITIISTLPSASVGACWR